MTIPFANLVHKMRARLSRPSPVGPTTALTAAPTRHDKKPDGQRLSKTVMPNVTRTIAAQDPLQAASIATAPNALTAAKAKPPMISVGGTQAAQPKHDLPPAIALALEPKVERAISLQLSEILPQVPAGYIKSEESFDPTRRILLKAVEIEKGMAQRNPTVALTSIYEQIPDIFMRSVPLSDQTRIELPFDKVLDQFNRLQVRRDQIRDSLAPQVDTPFLLVALEESQKFGTTIDPLQASAHPPVKVEPATADAFAAAEPEATESVKVTPTSAPRSTIPIPDLAVAKSSPPESSPKRIPFHLPPKGTGAPASERVPASSGPPVLPPSIPPLTLKSERPLTLKPEGPVKSAPPARPVLPKLEPPVLPPILKNPYETIPFDQLTSSAQPPRQGEPVQDQTKSTPVRQAQVDQPPRKRKPVEPLAFEPLAPSLATPLSEVTADASTVPAAAEKPKQDEMISLSLRELLRNLPAFQRQGDPNLAPEDAKVSFPFAMIAPQLAAGSVSVSSKLFHEAIPADYRYLFHEDAADAPVVLSLPEVLKNVPASALQIRTDQEQLAKTEAIETPFSIQAEEDARRLSAETEGPLSLESIFERPRTESKPEEKIDKEQPEKVDAKQIVERATALPGINGCAITFADGLSLAGNLPSAIAADGLCAVAPTLLQRIDKHMLDTKLGSLASMTLHGATSAVTFFMHGNVCFSVLHTTDGLAPDTRRQLAQMVNDLSRTYSQPETNHVDH